LLLRDSGVVCDGVIGWIVGVLRVLGIFILWFLSVSLASEVSFKNEYSLVTTSSTDEESVSSRETDLGHVGTVSIIVFRG
jgi:hypothetical protein